MAQGYMRQLRAHSGQCEAGEKAVCFPAENMWMNRCNPALWKSLLRTKRVFWRCSGGIALFRALCVVSTAESGDFEGGIDTGWGASCRVFTAKSGYIGAD